MSKLLAAVLVKVSTRPVERLKRLSKYLLYSVISLLGLIPFWLLRVRTPLLGDGYLRAGELKLGTLISITEPADFYLHLLFFRLFGLDTYTTYGILSCVAGGLYIFLILLLCDLWGKDGKEKLLIFSILVTVGAIQLFFGYIESYSFMYVFMTAYILFSLRYLRGKGGFLWPSLFLLLAAGFHLSALFVLPSLFYLAFAGLPQTARQEAGRIRFANIVILVCLTSLMWLGFYLLKTYSQEGPAGSFLIYPFGGGESFYSFFSLAHLLDFLNHQALIFPVSPVFWVVLLALFGKSVGFRETAVRFLLLVTVCSFAFALLVDPKLGYARDWDLFAFAGLGIGLLGLFLFLNIYRVVRQDVGDGEGPRIDLTRLALVLAVTSLVFTLPWILINASEKKATARLEHLLKVDERRAAHGYEILACYLRDKGEDQKSIESWKKAIAIYPVPRYFATLGNAYARLKRYDQAIEAYDRCIKMEPYGPASYLLHRSLGLCLANVGRYDEAIAQLKKAISFKPDQAEYHYSLGNILGKAGRYEEAVPHFETAIRLDPRNITAYKNLGLCYARIGKKEEARRYLETYLKSMPDDSPGMKGIIDSIQIEIESDR